VTLEPIPYTLAYQPMAHGWPGAYRGSGTQGPSFHRSISEYDLQMAFELLLGQIRGGHSLTGVSENEARKALVRLLSIDAPLDRRLREMLAGLFDPDPPALPQPNGMPRNWAAAAGEQKLVFKNRSSKRRNQTLRNLRIGAWMENRMESARASGEKVRVEDTFYETARHFRLGYYTIEQIWSEYRRAAQG
jgi:hypothetical protein